MFLGPWTLPAIDLLPRQLAAAAAAALAYRPRRVMASLPRSGTHWLKATVGDVWGRRPLEKRLLEPPDLRAALAGPAANRLIYEHLDCDRHAAALDPVRFPELRLVLLIRHPLDAALSQMHLRARSGKPFPDGCRTPDDAFRLYVRGERIGEAGGAFGAGVRDFVRRYALGWIRAGGWHVVRYENLLSDPATALAAVLDHLRIPHDPGRIDRALKRNSFERLSGGRKPGTEDRSSHYRKGVAGGWKEILSADDVRAVDRHWGDMIREMGYRLD